MGSKKNQQRTVMLMQDVIPVKKNIPSTKKNKISSVLSHLGKLTKRKKRIGIVLLIVLGIIVMALFISNYVINPFVDRSKNSDDNTEKTSQGLLVRGKPNYTVLLPSGKTIDSLGGGWVRNDAQPLFVYVDKIGSTQINVSEQPLPQDLQADTELEVEKLAHNYNITEKVSVGSTTIYIGTFDKGLQRVILSKNNLLILITSNDNLTNDTWIQYINSLS